MEISNDAAPAVSAAPRSGRASLPSPAELSRAILDNLIRRAVMNVFGELCADVDLDSVVRAFDDGWKVEVGDDLPSSEYADGVDQIPGLRKAVEHLVCGDSPARIAAAVEFVLEGLHLSNKLNREVAGGRLVYG